MAAMFSFAACSKSDPQTNDPASEKDETVTVDDSAGSSINVNNSEDNISATTFARTVKVVYSSGGASVTGADGLSCSVSGNDVTITNNGDEVIMYELSGSSTDGFFKLYSSRKQGITLNSLTLTNPAGAAINNQSHKRTFMVVKGTNNIADGSSYSDEVSTEDMKAAIFSEGQLIFSGDGSLNVTATGKGGITSDDYVRFMDGATSVVVNSSAGHGVRGKDAIIVTDGNIDVSVSGTGKKGFSADTLVYIGGGVTKIDVTGSAGTVDGEVTGSAGIRADVRFEMTGGSLGITCSGSGSKGISSDNVGFFKGGKAIITCTGKNYGSSYSSKSAKGVKFDGNLYFSDNCSVVVNSSSNEGIEAKGLIQITGGTVYSYSAADDAINSGSHMNISGGYVYGRSFRNDGLDANGNMNISGGVVYASGAGSPEVALDANTERNYKLTISGGTVIAFGGIERGSSVSIPYVAVNYSKKTYYSLEGGDTNLMCLKSPDSAGTGMYIFGGGLSKGSSYKLVSGVTVSGGTSYFGGYYFTGATATGGSSTTVSAK